MGIFAKIQGFIGSEEVAALIDLQGRHFIVTGCAEGSFGFATAWQLLARGAVVSVAVRKNSKAIAAVLGRQVNSRYHQNIHAFDLDLSQRSLNT
jgi:NAD(P)-dependent dehydrogenase (short-subunit alcohol dehydrogenase family)